MQHRDSSSTGERFLLEQTVAFFGLQAQLILNEFESENLPYHFKNGGFRWENYFYQVQTAQTCGILVLNWSNVKSSRASSRNINSSS